MKQLIFGTLVCLLAFSCTKDNSLAVESNEKTHISSKSKGQAKVDVCHNGHIINVSVKAIPAHLAHGDGVDMDGDGFFHIDTPCSPKDCNDDDAAVNPDAAEACDDLIDNDCDDLADCDDPDCDDFADCADCCITPYLDKILENVQVTSPYIQLSSNDLSIRALLLPPGTNFCGSITTTYSCYLWGSAVGEEGNCPNWIANQVTITKAQYDACLALILGASLKSNNTKSAASADPFSF